MGSCTGKLLTSGLLSSSSHEASQAKASAIMADVSRAKSVQKAASSTLSSLQGEMNADSKEQK